LEDRMDIEQIATTIWNEETAKVGAKRVGPIGGPAMAAMVRVGRAVAEECARMARAKAVDPLEDDEDVVQSMLELAHEIELSAAGAPEQEQGPGVATAANSGGDGALASPEVAGSTPAPGAYPDRAALVERATPIWREWFNQRTSHRTAPELMADFHLSESASLRAANTEWAGRQATLEKINAQLIDDLQASEAWLVHERATNAELRAERDFLARKGQALGRQNTDLLIEVQALRASLDRARAEGWEEGRDEAAECVEKYAHGAVIATHMADEIRSLQPAPPSAPAESESK
jgi:hypothetical protein